MALVVDSQKERDRMVWAAGNYAVVAQLLVEPAHRLIERAGIAREMAVLDVATGTGNVAIPAAKRGASVVGLDLTPEMLDKARARALAAGVQVDWVIGDAEELPLPDASFDAVLSSFGVQFAQNPARAAAELVRVCRPGGVIGLCCWTPEGVAGRYVALLRRHVGRRNDGPSSTDWGRENTIRSLFSASGLQFSFERDMLLTDWESVDSSVAFLEHNYGCAITARRALEPLGRWRSLRSDIHDLFESNNRAEESSGLLLAEEYMLVTGRKPS
jgi:SAM-dependent methyltransferase